MGRKLNPTKEQIEALKHRLLEYIYALDTGFLPPCTVCFQFDGCAECPLSYKNHGIERLKPKYGCQCYTNVSRSLHHAYKENYKDLLRERYNEITQCLEACGYDYK